jgi:hypothetical protein
VAGGFELADFAAASLKFRAEMAEMTLGDDKVEAEEDTMEGLLKQQKLADRDMGYDEEEDEEAMPDWADENDAAEIATKNSEVEKKISLPNQLPGAKRNLLLEVYYYIIFRKFLFNFMESDFKCQTIYGSYCFPSASRDFCCTIHPYSSAFSSGKQCFISKFQRIFLTVK